jgi:uroporphyrinogen-III decarboxylase
MHSTRPLKFCGRIILWPGAGLLNYPVHCLGAPIKDDSKSTPALQGPAISSLDELDKLDMGTALGHPIMQSMIQSTVLMADNIGYETALMQTQWGPFTTAARIMGVEKLMMATVMNPDKLEALIDFSAPSSSGPCARPCLTMTACWASTFPSRWHHAI